jgi:hypothetical protein
MMTSWTGEQMKEKVKRTALLQLTIGTVVLSKKESCGRWAHAIEWRCLQGPTRVFSIEQEAEAGSGPGIWSFAATRVDEPARMILVAGSIFV